MKVFGSGGRGVSLGARIADGGEAEIHEVLGTPSQVAKIYRAGKATRERQRKLDVMLAAPPKDPSSKSGHCSISWPQELLTDGAGRFVGFLMPRVDTHSFRTLIRVYHVANYPPRLDWSHLMLVARNMSASLQALHDKGYVVGDLNESNVLASDRCLITFVDCDSMQVPDYSGGRVLRCLVGKADYTPPEHQGKSFADFDREPSSDRFALAVLICQLSMLGRHPFAGGSHPSIEENIRHHETFFSNGGQSAPWGTPPVATLPPELLHLFENAFGRRSAGRRPTAGQWRDALDALKGGLATCRKRPRHVYSGHLSSCPWCRYQRIYRFDPFGLATSASLQIPSSSLMRRPLSGPTPIRPWRRLTVGALVVAGALWWVTSRESEPRILSRPPHEIVEAAPEPAETTVRAFRAEELPRFFTGAVAFPGMPLEAATLTVEAVKRAPEGDLKFAFALNTLSSQAEGIALLERGGRLHISEDMSFMVSQQGREVVLRAADGIKGELRGWLP